jgi:hypothetical protein
MPIVADPTRLDQGKETMAGIRNDEADIFYSAFSPDPQDQGPASSGREVIVPDHQESDVVSSIIQSLQREPIRPEDRRSSPPPALRDRQPREPQGQEPDDQGKPPQQGLDPNGILAELREERRSRQALERKLEELTGPKAAPPTPFNQRVFEDPEPTITGVVDAKLSPIQMEVQNLRSDFAFQVAELRHGDAFKEAYREWFGRVSDQAKPDPDTYWKIMGNPNPGEALMAWHNGNRIQTEIGGDLEAYRDKVRAEILAEMGMGDAPPPRTNGRAPAQADDAPRGTNGRFAPRHEVRLPTSTAKLGHSGRGTVIEPEDGSEDAIFAAGWAKPERR